MDQAQQTRRPVAQLGASGPGRQRGWVGLVMILIALVIVAVLAQRALKGYGLLPGADLNTHAGSRVPPAASATGVDPTSVPATPAQTLDRVRGLEQQVQKSAQDQEQHIDEQTK